MLKVNREADNNLKSDLLNKEEIYFEKEAVELLGFNWCSRRYCNVDGCLPNMLLDVKNKRRFDGKGEKFTRYNHNLGLIISAQELFYMAALKNSITQLNSGYFIYYFENEMYGVELNTAMIYGMPAPHIGNSKKIIYYIPFNYWKIIKNQKDLKKLHLDHNIYDCIKCKQPSYASYHNPCRIEKLSKRLRACHND